VDRNSAVSDRWNAGILLFPAVEVLDFAGPYEVLSRARTEPGVESRRDETTAPFRVFTVARQRKPLATVGGLVVTPHYTFDDHPTIDLLVVPGGFGARALLDDAATLDWIRRVAATARLVSSVCTGALLLARAGLLDGRRATTHHAALDALATAGERITVVRDIRVVDDTVLTSAGVAAGMDLAFHVVERVCTRAVAVETAAYIEYPWAGLVMAETGAPRG
jgi:transcriptional regulator GlxA family with amidase domain